MTGLIVAAVLLECIRLSGVETESLFTEGAQRESLVWADVRRFLNDPAQILERLRDVLGDEVVTEELHTPKGPSCPSASPAGKRRRSATSEPTRTTTSPKTSSVCASRTSKTNSTTSSSS